MASIYPRGKYWWIEYTVNGERIQKSLKPLLAKDPVGKKKAKEFQRQIELGLLQEDEFPFVKKQISLMFSDAKQKFLENKKGIKPKTKEIYELAFDQFSRIIGDKKVKSITAADINKFIDQLREEKKSENTIELYTRQIRQLFVYLAEEGLVKNNPVHKNKKLGLKSKPNEAIEIPPDDFKRILDFLKKNNIWQYRAVMFMRLTAVHPIEVCTVKWENIYWKQKYILFDYVKSDEPHKFPLYEQLYDFLSEFKEARGKIFPYKDHYSMRFWRRAIAAINKEAKEESQKIPNYHLTDIRNTTITDIIEMGASFDEIHSFTGHNDPKVTWKHYKSSRIKKQADSLSDKIQF